MGENSVDFSAAREWAVVGRVALLFLIAQRTLPVGKHFLVAYLYTLLPDADPRSWYTSCLSPCVAISLAYIRRDRLPRAVRAILRISI